MDRIVHTVKSAGERATTAMRGKPAASRRRASCWPPP